jgi:predicted RNA polymerase sigma factor
MPAHAEWTQRLRSGLHVLYLIFNEGYAKTAPLSMGWAVG